MQTGAATGNEMGRPSPDAATLIRRWFDQVWNKKMAESIDEIVPASSVMWGIGRPDAPAHGPAAFKEFHRGLLSACPNMHITLEQVVQEGDTAFARWTATMTHTGDGLGMPPTNQEIKTCGMSACRVRDGVIVESWNSWDQIGLARQLGVLQGPAAEMFP